MGRPSRAVPGRALPAAVLAALFVGTLAGCGRSSGGNSSGASSLAFKVVRTHPEAGAAGVATDATIEVDFSRDVEPSSLTSDTFQVTGSTSGQVDGVFGVTALGTKVVFVSTMGLASGESVTVRLTEGIRSRAASTLEPFEFEFTADDSVPPPPPPPPALTVLEVSPEAGAIGAATEAEILAVFSEALDPALLVADHAWIESEHSGRLPAELEIVDQAATTLRLRPVEPLEAGVRVSVHLSSDILAESGATFAGHAWSFRVHEDPPARPRNVQRVFGTLGNVTHLETGDLDGDGRTDAVYASDAGEFVDVLVATEDGDLELAVRIDVAQDVRALELADADRDGDLDLIVGTPDRATLWVNRRVEDALPPDQVRFERGPEAAPLPPVRHIEVADLDHRGRPDVILDTEGGLQIRLDGVDEPPAEILGTQGQASTAVVARDLDLDGWVDLAFGDAAGAGVKVCLARPSVGSAIPAIWLSAPVLVGADVTPRHLLVEDLQGDRLPDLVILTAGSESQPSRVSVLLQTASGFDGGEGGGAGAGEPADGIAAIDLDGNGFEDLVVALLAENRVEWHPNDAGTLDLDAPGQRLADLPKPGFVRRMRVSAGTGDGAGAGADVLAAGGNEIHLLLQGEDDPPPPPDDTFEVSIDPLQARRGAVGAAALVRLTSSQPLQGYSVVLGFDPLSVTPRDVSLEGSVTAAAAPEFTSFRLLEESPVAVYSVLVDILEPISGTTIPVGEDQLLFRLVVDVPETAPLGSTSLEFVADPGPPALETTLVVDSMSVSPTTVAGPIQILPREEPPPPGSENSMALGSATLEAGETARIALVASVKDPIDAFTVVITHDPGAISISEFDLAGTATEAKAPEMVIPSIDPAAGYAIFTVILDFLPPFDRQKIPAGQDLVLCHVVASAKGDAPGGLYPLTLSNGVGPSQLENIFSVNGLTVYPELTSGAITVPGGGGEARFVRGDADRTGSVNLSDSVFILNYLFRGGAGPDCPDAADADDDGGIRLTDGVYLLEYLFRSGPLPPPPHPDPGVDPTPDGLGC